MMKPSFSLSLLFFLATPGLVGAQAEIRIVTLGDSITRGVRPGVKTEETFAALLQKGLKEQKLPVEVTNVGIGGERTDQALKRLARDVLSRKPKIVTIMYGTNDSYVDRGKKESRLSVDEYRANLHKLVAELRQAGIQPVLMTSPRWGDKATNGIGENPNLRLEAFVRVCREVAQETKTPLVDHFAHWSKKAADGGDIATWTTDQCHANPQGHREIAELMLPVILRELAK